MSTIRLKIFLYALTLTLLTNSGQTIYAKERKPSKREKTAKDSLTVDDVCDYIDALRLTNQTRKAEEVCLNNAYKGVYSRYQRYQNTLEALAMRHSIQDDPGYKANKLPLNSENAAFWERLFEEHPAYRTSFSNFNPPGKVVTRRKKFRLFRKKRKTTYIPISRRESKAFYAQPFIMNEGKSMLFSSNRPGGFGGYDLYVAHFDPLTNTWGVPVNLGPEVNTEGNEIFPVLHEDRLIFSSNGLPGFGGYDLYNALFTKDRIIPGSVTHLPQPVNSAFNDYCMLPVSKKEAYFVSDRDLESPDDIYYLSMLEELGAPAKVTPFGMTEEAAIKGGQLLFSGMTEDVITKTVSLKRYAPKGKLFSLYFDFDSAELTPESVRTLEQFTNQMGGYEFEELTFEGFADEMGGENYNFRLSERRANAVADFLREQGMESKFIIAPKGRTKLKPSEIKAEIGQSYWQETPVNWIYVNRKARRVDIYNE